MTHESTSKWEQSETVSSFANREADRRMLELIDRVRDPTTTTVLDLGCAGGRNTVVLAERGFDVQARDASRAMVAHTRDRVAALVGEAEAERRIRLGRMDDLGEFETRSFQLMLALGVYHCASSSEEWHRALSESARVLAESGHLLVSLFDPETDLHGTGIRRLPGEEHLYEGFSSGPCFLVDAPTLDDEMAKHGLTPAVPSTTVRVPLEKGRRVVVNALYGKPFHPVD